MGRDSDDLEHPSEHEEPTPSFSDAVAAAARRSGLGHVKPGEAPSARALLAAVGGIRGLVESILPPLLFLVVYTITQQLVPSVLAPLAIAVVFIVVRVLARQPVMTAVVGALGVGVSAGLALVSGRASDNFLPGLIINVVIFIVAALLFTGLRIVLKALITVTPPPPAPVTGSIPTQRFTTTRMRSLNPATIAPPPPPPPPPVHPTAAPPLDDRE